MGDLESAPASGPVAAGASGFLVRRFALAERGSDVRTEVLAGATTFLTMAYIVVVNPAILGQAGMPVAAVAAATCFAAGVASILMGLLADAPLALAPGMGLNAYFSMIVVQQMHVPWPVALGCVFLSGLLFLALTLLGIRQMIVAAIPPHLFAAIAGGIGLFVGFIGLKDAGIVVANPATFVGLGGLRSGDALLALCGLGLIATLWVWRVRGAILIGIVATTVLAAALGRVSLPAHAAFSTDLGGTVFRLDLKAVFAGGVPGFGIIEILFVFLFVDLFDNLGTLVAVTRRAGIVDAAGRVPRLNRMLVADSLATMIGACAGTSTVTSYVESVAGVQEGGRTGLTAIVTGILFLCAMLVAPYAQLVPLAATAPALILVGAMMLGPLAEIDWADAAVAIPSFLTVALIPLTFSIANGLAFGIVAHAVIRIARGDVGRGDWLLLVLAGLFVARFAWLSAA